MNTTNTTHKLTVETLKDGRFLYSIVEIATNSVIRQRKSQNKYVACMVEKDFYFGRLDLVGKSDSGKWVALRISKGAPATVAYLEWLHPSTTN